MGLSPTQLRAAQQIMDAIEIDGAVVPQQGLSPAQLAAADSVISAPADATAVVANQPPVRQLGDRPAPIPQTSAGASSFEIGDIGRALENAPAEAEDLQSGLETLGSAFMQNPFGLMTTIAQADVGQSSGLMKEVAERVGIEDFDPALGIPEALGLERNRPEATRLGEEVGRDIVTSAVDSTRKTVVENPVQSLMALLGLRQVTAPSPTRLQTLAKIDPAIEGGHSGIIVKGARFASERAGAASGAGAAVGRQVFDAGLRGGPSSRAVGRARSGKITMDKISSDVRANLSEAEDMVKMGFQEATEKLDLKDPTRPIDPKSVRRDVIALLDKEKFKVRATNDGRLIIDPKGSVFEGRPGELTTQGDKIAQAVELLDQWTDTSIQGSHTLQRRLDNIIKPTARGDNADALRVMTQIRNELVGHLKQRVDGYAERAEEYAAGARFLDGFRKAFGINDNARGPLEPFGIVTRQEFVDESTLTKLTQLMNDRKNQNLGTRQALLEEIERVIERKRLKELGIDTEGFGS